jgi:hypothetical protein
MPSSTGRRYHGGIILVYGYGLRLLAGAWLAWLPWGFRASMGVPPPGHSDVTAQSRPYPAFALLLPSMARSRWPCRRCRPGAALVGAWWVPGGYPDGAPRQPARVAARRYNTVPLPYSCPTLA